MKRFIRARLYKLSVNKSRRHCSLSVTFLGTNPAAVSETASSIVELVPFCAQKEEEKSRWLQGWVSCLATAQHCRGPLYKDSALATLRKYLLEDSIMISQILLKKLVWARARGEWS